LVAVVDDVNVDDLGVKDDGVKADEYPTMDDSRKDVTKDE